MTKKSSNFFQNHGSPLSSLLIQSWALAFGCSSIGTVHSFQYILLCGLLYCIIKQDFENINGCFTCHVRSHSRGCWNCACNEKTWLPYFCVSFCVRIRVSVARWGVGGGEGGVELMKPCEQKHHYNCSVPAAFPPPQTTRSYVSWWNSIIEARASLTRQIYDKNYLLTRSAYHSNAFWKTRDNRHWALHNEIRSPRYDEYQIQPYTVMHGTVILYYCIMKQQELR